jgi:hypothetical protein
LRPVPDFDKTTIDDIGGAQLLPQVPGLKNDNNLDD